MVSPLSLPSDIAAATSRTFADVETRLYRSALSLTLSRGVRGKQSGERPVRSVSELRWQGVFLNFLNVLLCTFCFVPARRQCLGEHAEQQRQLL
jgi:hypothetical protein